FYQAEDGIRDFHVTGVQTCALPILIYTNPGASAPFPSARDPQYRPAAMSDQHKAKVVVVGAGPAGSATALHLAQLGVHDVTIVEIGRASCRERERASATPRSERQN